MELTLEQIELWAKQAGLILKQGFGKQHEIGFKTESDLVTEVDRQAEAFLIGQIQQAFPEHKIIGEENGTIKGDQTACWYIDPVDGTTNYAHGFPYFCVSLGFADQTGSKFGVIYDPIADECFSAERGKGAFLNGQSISVSGVDDLKRSLLVTGYAHNEPEMLDHNNELFIRLNERGQALRRMGSAAMNLANVAAGRLDAYWELVIKPWDIGAGLLIVREAGGIVSRSDGSQEELLNPPCSIIAAAPGVYEALLEAVQ